MTHEHVSLRGDGDRQPGGDADGRVEQVVRVRVHVTERAVTHRRVQVYYERYDRVDGIVEKFDCIGHRKADQKRVGRRRHLAATQHYNTEDVSGQSEETHDGIEEQTGDQLCQQVELSPAIVLVHGLAGDVEYRQRADVCHVSMKKRSVRPTVPTDVIQCEQW